MQLNDRRRPLVGFRGLSRLLVLDLSCFLPFFLFLSPLVLVGGTGFHFGGGWGGEGLCVGMRDAVLEYVAGVVAGSSALISGYPFDTVKVRLQSVGSVHYHGPMDCTTSILRHEGVRRGNEREAGLVVL